MPSRRLRLETTGGGNRPSFAIVHRDFTDGVLEVAIAGTLTGKGAPDDRGFVGLSFHITPDFPSHETVYLRMTNGRLNVPPPPEPRFSRAIQYVADPGFHFSESREQFPGRYEKGADIAVGRWCRLRLEIAGPRLRALVDGAEVLVGRGSALRRPPRPGRPVRRRRLARLLPGAAHPAGLEGCRFFLFGRHRNFQRGGGRFPGKSRSGTSKVPTLALAASSLWTMAGDSRSAKQRLFPRAIARNRCSARDRAVSRA